MPVWVYSRSCSCVWLSLVSLAFDLTNTTSTSGNHKVPQAVARSQLESLYHSIPESHTINNLCTSYGVTQKVKLSSSSQCLCLVPWYQMPGIWKYTGEYTRGPSTFPSGKDWFMPRQTHKVEPSFIDHDLSYTGVQQQRWQMTPFVDIMVKTSKIDYPPLISPWPSPTVVKLRSKVPIDSRE